MSALSVLELERETVELLPRREALGRKRRTFGNVNTTVAISTNVSIVEQNATAVAISTGYGDATALAGNYSEVYQSAVSAAVSQ
jgi:hypothetical protein